MIVDRLLEVKMVADVVPGSTSAIADHVVFSGLKTSRKWCVRSFKVSYIQHKHGGEERVAGLIATPSLLMWFLV